MRRIAAAVFATLLSTVPLHAQTLRMGLGEDADILDPTFSRTYIGRVMFASMCDKLFDIDATLNIVPQLGTGYEWADPLTLVIKLRPGVLFHDGEKMDAASVKYSLDRHLGMSGSFRRSEISSMDHVEIVDPMTVKIILKQPFAPFVAQLTDRAGMVVSPKAAEATGKDFGLHPVCTGPFKFTERVPQDRVVVDRFPGYWNAGAIHFDRVVYQPIIDSATRLANLQAGALEMSSVLPTDAAAVRADPKLVLTVWDWLGYNGITLNVGNGPRANTKFGTDRRVRQAFELALDRQALVQVVYEGMYTPTNQAVPPSSPYHAPSIKPPLRDPARAKALLREAGVTLPYKLELMVSNLPDSQQVGEVIQSMAAEAGFEVKLVAVESASALAAAARGDFEALMVYWSGRSDPDGNLWSFIHSGAAQNDGRFSNPAIDTLLDQARGVTDIPARRAIYEKMWGVAEQELPIIYLWHPKHSWGLSRKLANFTPVPDGIIRLQGMTLAK
jgi:peptide/nickel transport system substrate-binding protein